MTFGQQIMRGTGMEMKRRKSTVKFKLYSVFIVSFAVPLTVLSICFIIYYYCMTMMNGGKENGRADRLFFQS